MEVEVVVLHMEEVAWGVDLDPMTEAMVDLREDTGATTCQCKG